MQRFYSEFFAQFGKESLQMFRDRKNFVIFAKVHKKILSISG